MSALLGAGATDDVHSMLLRLVDFLKGRGITAVFTNLGVSRENATLLRWRHFRPMVEMLAQEIPSLAAQLGRQIARILDLILGKTCLDQS
jgi:hypothetical protein